MQHPQRRVLLTGASGFVASHILKELIEHDFKPVGTVRSQSAAAKILELHPEWEGKVQFAFVPDIAAPDAFDDLFNKEKEKFEFVIHTAMPINWVSKNVQKDVIDPAIQGTINIIKSAHKLGGSDLKRMVLLGSGVSILDSFKKGGERDDYTEDDWNPVTLSQAVEAQDPILAYNVAKKMSEQAAWNFIEQERPTFDLVVMNPNVILGPILQYIPGPQKIGTNSFLYNFVNGTHQDLKDVKFLYYHFVDVRDVARAHVLALTNPAASGQRIILVAGVMSPKLINDIMRQNFPQLRNRLPKGELKDILPPDVKLTGWDTSKSYRIFGKDWAYTGLEKTVVDTTKDLIELKRKWDEKL